MTIGVRFETTADHDSTRASLVAEADGHVVGHTVFSTLPIVTPGGMVEALSLAPLSVIPSQQRRGIGSMLVRVVMMASRSHARRGMGR